ncbi:MAG: DUF996 domain-containing protein [Candidatus Caldarchaeum sp.]
MADISQARLLGGIGSILLVLAIVPYAGSALSIVGLILLLISLKQLSDIFHEPEIFKNALIAVVVGIIGAVAGIVVGGVGVLSMFAGGLDGSNIGNLIFSILLALAVVWVFAVVSSLFLRRSLTLTGNRLGIGLFRTAGLLIFIGAILMIILVGAIIELVAYIILAVAFFQIKPGFQPPPPPPP